MGSFLKWFKGVLAQEPVLTSYLANGGIAAIAAFFLHWTTTQEAALTTIVAGLVAIYTVIRTTPFHVSGISGAMATMITAAAAFGLHVSPKGQALLVMAIAALVPLMIRVHVSPVTKSS